MCSPAAEGIGSSKCATSAGLIVIPGWGSLEAFVPRLVVTWKAYDRAVMPVHRTYGEWDPADELDPEAQAVLDLVDALANEKRVPAVDELVASIDGYGVVSIDIPVAGQASLFLQAGDGWNRVLWTTTSGRTFEWTWREPAASQQIRALLDGRGTERATFVGRRRLTSALVVDGETVSVSGGIWRPIARLLPLTVRERPAV